MSEQDIHNTIVTTSAELEHLKQRVRDLERELSNLPTRQLPDTLLFSQTFLKRAFAVWCHNAVISLIVSVPFGCLWGFIATIITSK